MYSWINRGSCCYEQRMLWRRYFKDFLISIEVIDIENCIEKEIKHDDIKFFYRGVNLSKKLIITSVKLKGKSESKDIIEKIQNDMILKRK